MSDHGRIGWHDLMTTEAAASYRFYTQLFGWTSLESPDSIATSHYVHLRAGDREIGGMIPMPKEAGVPTNWLPYVMVDDADAAARRTVEAGGRIVRPAQDIEVGRFVVLADSQNAAFAVYQHTKGQSQLPPPGSRPAASTFCWDELYAKDTDAAQAFYSQVFGWEVTPMDMGEHGTYFLFKRAGEANALGGMMLNPPGHPAPPHWLSYVAVANTDETLERAKGLGASVLVPAIDVPNVGRFAILMDPQQAAIGILQGAA